MPVKKTGKATVGYHRFTWIVGVVCSSAAKSRRLLARLVLFTASGGAWPMNLCNGTIEGVSLAVWNKGVSDSLVKDQSNVCLIV